MRHAKWREKNGVIYFSVSPIGITGERWIERLERLGCRVGDDAKDVLLSDGFKSTGGATIKIAVLKYELFCGHHNDYSDMNNRNIRAMASKLNLVRPKADVACLIREKFEDEEIGDMGLLGIVTMHKPIKTDYSRDPLLLCVDCDDNDEGDFMAYLGRSDYMWPTYSSGEYMSYKLGGGGGFAFAVSPQ